MEDNSAVVSAETSVKVTFSSAAFWAKMRMAAASPSEAEMTVRLLKTDFLCCMGKDHRDQLIFRNQVDDFVSVPEWLARAVEESVYWSEAAEEEITVFVMQPLENTTPPFLLVTLTGGQTGTDSRMNKRFNDLIDEEQLSDLMEYRRVSKTIVGRSRIFGPMRVKTNWHRRAMAQIEKIASKPLSW